jgi:glycosyltransferase involved in cell wall biosynthesis
VRDRESGGTFRVISFIVPAYNEESLIGPTLRALHAAACDVGERYEVVVVDDASSDRTAAVAASLGARVVQVANRQIAATRNAGARQAEGDLLVFVDADTLVSDAAVREAVRALRAGAVGGGAGVRFEGRLPLYARLLQPISIRLFRIARLAAGCFLFCTRRAFDAVGGFDESLYGAEEIAMSMALKRHGRFVVLREAVTTSGRKLRAHSGWELLRVVGGLVLRGPGSVRARQGLAIWYEERRDDPDSVA